MIMDESGDSQSDSDCSSMGDEQNDVNDKHIANSDKKCSKVYLPTLGLQNGEQLVHDESSYVMYHQAQTGSPCLSFDVLYKDKNSSADFPATMYIVAGTQSDASRGNHVIVMKMANLHKTKEERDDEEDDEDLESDEDEDLKPILDTAMRIHRGGVNRIRCTELSSKHLAATWSEHGSVHIWDLGQQLTAVSNPSAMADYLRDKQRRSAPPVFTFAGHLSEGFALDWSALKSGWLLSGDCRNNIHLWKPHDSASWQVDQRPFIGHEGSVEDIQWSPNEHSVFSSCSVDKTVRIWDVRASPTKACMLTTKAHDCDVNVMSWNRNDPFIVSGGDDGMVKVWDLRQFKKGEAVATFKHHSEAITSVEWHATDSSVFAAAGADNQISQWDLAVEPDNCSQESDKLSDEVPPQLLFIHQGQKDIKELHWHRQYSGVLISTALDGFNVFKTISV